jgi:predicted enzyme related to lactoylglutathione lyase
MILGNRCDRVAGVTTNSGAQGPIHSINAVTLAVSDMSGACQFYEALGFGVTFGGAHSAFTSLDAGQSFLNLQLDVALEARSAAPRGPWGRIIFFVDDVDAMYDRVVAAGGVPHMAPSDAPWGERYFHVTDPAGHELSFARPLP